MTGRKSAHMRLIPSSGSWLAHQYCPALEPECFPRALSLLNWNCTGYLLLKPIASISSKSNVIPSEVFVHWYSLLCSIGIF